MPQKLVLKRRWDNGGEVFEPADYKGEIFEVKDPAEEARLINEGTMEPYIDEDLKSMKREIAKHTKPGGSRHKIAAIHRKDNDPTSGKGGFGDPCLRSKKYDDLFPYARGGGRFDSFDEQCKAVLAGNDPRLTVVDKDLSEGSGASGGFLVEQQTVREIFDTSLEAEIVRPRATVYPTRSNNITVRAMDIGDHDNGIAGVVATWTAEAASKTKTDPIFREMNMRVGKLVCYTVTSDELADDTQNLGQVIGNAFSKAMTWYLDSAFINGLGGNDPMGILQADCLISHSRATASKIRWPDLANMWAKLAPGSHKRAVWMVSPAGLVELMKLSVEDHAGTIQSGYWVSAAGAPALDTLFGRPLIVTEHCAALGTVGDLILADWSQYIIALRHDFRLETTNAENFRTDQTSWRAVIRIDGQPGWHEAVTLKDNTTASPFVALAAP